MPNRVSLAEPVDTGRLRKALATIPEGAWSQPSRYRQNGVHHGYRVIRLGGGQHWSPMAGPFRFVLDRYTPVRAAFLSWLAPGGFIAPHRDRGPYLQRWQVPVQAAGMFDADRPADGVPFPVEHWREHAVWNDTDLPRIHLVIDRDLAVDVPAAPYERFPTPDQFQHLIDAASI